MQSLWISFSQALGLNSYGESSQNVRSREICIDTLANECMELDKDHEGILGEEGSEGRVIPGKGCEWRKLLRSSRLETLALKGTTHRPTGRYILIGKILSGAGDGVCKGDSSSSSSSRNLAPDGATVE